MGSGIGTSHGKNNLAGIGAGLSAIGYNNSIATLGG